jgi:hypothetical protein
MSLIPLLFWQLPASLGEEIREAKSAVRNSCPLHWLRLDSRCSPRHHTPPLLPASLSWSGATATVSVATKWGRSRPLQCITRVQTARRAACNLYAPNNFASPLGDVNGDGDGYVCLSRTRHLPRLKRPLNPTRIFPSTITAASETKKCKGQIATGTGACPGLPSFLDHSWNL